MPKKKTTTITKIRQKKVVESILKNTKVKSRCKAMIEAGYSPSYAYSGQITKTKTWNDYMDEHFSDDKVAKAEAIQLSASRLYDYEFPPTSKDADIKKDIESHSGCKLVRIYTTQYAKKAYFYTPDNVAIGKSLDRIYKMKKRYDNTIKIKRGISELSDAELEEIATGALSDALDSIAGAEEEKGA